MPLHFEEDALDGVAPKDTQRVIDKIEWLWANRRSVTHHPLKENLAGLYKKRFGKYRIVYAFEDDESEEIMVVRIVGTRDDIYKEASRG
jgi:mRNA-degrading endonuclease RelE of RelBE toxin-antitoxin system